MFVINNHDALHAADLLSRW